ncbi:MAG: TetR/AcrR family transcriptional regulator, partial [Elusimicrobiota bacterium]
MKRKQEARRAAILDTALRLACDEGRAGLAINRIAEELDYTSGALYRYFESKEALLAELQDYAQRNILAALMKEVPKWMAKGTGAEAALYRLLAAADFYVGLKRVLPREAALIGLIVGDPGEFQSRQHTQRLNESAAALFAQGQVLFQGAEATGGLPKGDNRERALIFWSTLHGATQIWKLDKVEPRLKEPRYY